MKEAFSHGLKTPAATLPSIRWCTVHLLIRLPPCQATMRWSGMLELAAEPEPVSLTTVTLVSDVEKGRSGDPRAESRKPSHVPSWRRRCDGPFRGLRREQHGLQRGLGNRLLATVCMTTERSEARSTIYHLQQWLPNHRWRQRGLCKPTQYCTGRKPYSEWDPSVMNPPRKSVLPTEAGQGPRFVHLLSLTIFPSTSPSGKGTALSETIAQENEPLSQPAVCQAASHISNTDDIEE